MVIKNLKVFDAENGFIQGNLSFVEGRFCHQPQGETIDGNGLYAIPGLVDIHFHGCVGVDFCDGTTQSIQKIANFEAKNGVTSICPATMTLSQEETMKICKAAAEYHCNTGARLVGVYLEGPFISTEKKGAQNSKYIIPPNIEFLNAALTASNGLVKIVVIAPEVAGALEFIPHMQGKARVSIAHSQCDYSTAMKAFSLGASQVTHLYNAMSPFSHRAPGIIGAALDSPHAMVELITDGVHIHPSVVRATFKMFTEERIILISDSMMATGLPDGAYTLGGQKVWVENHCSRLQDGTIAGSASSLMNCLRVAVNQMGIPLWSAVKCATVNPAKAIGMYNEIGSLDSGKKADFVLLDENLAIQHVYIDGIQIPLDN